MRILERYDHIIERHLLPIISLAIYCNSYVQKTQIINYNIITHLRLNRSDVDELQSVYETVGDSTSIWLYINTIRIYESLSNFMTQQLSYTYLKYQITHVFYRQKKTDIPIVRIQTRLRY